MITEEIILSRGYIKKNENTFSKGDKIIRKSIEGMFILQIGKPETAEHGGTEMLGKIIRYESQL